MSTWDRPDSYRLFDGEDDWLRIAGGISIAGGAYPLVLMFIGLVVIALMLVKAALERGFYAISPVELVVMPFLIAIYAIFLGVVGMLWAAVVSLFVVPVFYLLVRSLQLQVSLIWLGAACGGLVGCVAVLAVILVAVGGMDDSIRGEAMVVFMLGPGLTTVLGQLGGAWGGRRSMLLSLVPKRGTCASLGNGQPVAIASSGYSTETGRRPLFHFRIRHLLWISVWLSLLLTAIRLTGIPFELILPVLFGWLLYQSMTLYFGWLIACRLVPRWRA